MDPESTRLAPVRDVVGRGLDALFVGINPGWASARAGHHFANPANPFWRLLHESGLVGRRLTPAEERELLDQGLGITNLVARATAGMVEWSGQAPPTSPPLAAASAVASNPTVSRARVFVVPNPSARNSLLRRLARAATCAHDLEFGGLLAVCGWCIGLAGPHHVCRRRTERPSVMQKIALLPAACGEKNSTTSSS